MYMCYFINCRMFRLQSFNMLHFYVNKYVYKNLPLGYFRGHFCTKSWIVTIQCTNSERVVRIDRNERLFHSMRSTSCSYSEMKENLCSTDVRLRKPCSLLSAQYIHGMANTYYPPQVSCVKIIGFQHQFSTHQVLNNNSSINDEDLKDEDGEYENIVERMFHITEMGHQVLVVQPFVKWGYSKKRNTTPDLQLSEAVSLVHTLRRWKVVDKMKIALQSLEKKTLFGSGNLEVLKEKIRKHKEITAIFISTDILRGRQRRELEAAFGVPVYDRYMMVIQIFKEHAVSKEAKLQVAMAEIPYLRMRIKGMHEGAPDHSGSNVAAIGGPGETYIEVRKRILNTREMKLKGLLEKVRNQRALLRNKRQKLECPVVAVVGYTNAGKTSLIKALTGEISLQPKNHLFATLDVTAHSGVLPSRLKVLYVDTVGFISDIPINLIESFVATLEDAMLADVIVHVCDVSHPDCKAQIETVTKTLGQLNLSQNLLDNILVVGNKLDLLPDKVGNKDLNCNLFVSAVTNEGLDDLVIKLDEVILKATGRCCVRMRVPSGGEESRWLYKNAAVTEVIADNNNSEFLLMTVVISEAQLMKFRHNFIMH